MAEKNYQKQPRFRGAVTVQVGVTIEVYPRGGGKGGK